MPSMALARRSSGVGSLVWEGGVWFVMHDS